MQDQADTVPHGYLYPFATVSDNYTFDDYWEDCLHFSTLVRQGDVPRKFAIPYFQVHYPPEESRTVRMPCFMRLNRR